MPAPDRELPPLVNLPHLRADVASAAKLGRAELIPTASLDPGSIKRELERAFAEESLLLFIRIVKQSSLAGDGRKVVSA